MASGTRTGYAWGLLALGCIGTTAVGAESRAPFPWPQEPRAMFGIRLGDPFPGPADIADCPRFAPFRREPLYDGICVDTSAGFDADRIHLKNVPLAELSSEAEVRLDEGRVRSIALVFEAARLDLARGLLVSRYGEPHEGGGDGGSAPAASPVRLVWRGPHTSITLSQAEAQAPARLEFAVAGGR